MRTNFSIILVALAVAASALAVAASYHADMPAPPKDWIALTAKLERAEEHIFNLKEFWNRFRDKAYPILFQDTPDGTYRMYYLGSVAPIPTDVPSITGAVRVTLAKASGRSPTSCTTSVGNRFKVSLPALELRSKVASMRNASSVHVRSKHQQSTVPLSISASTNPSTIGSF